MSETTSLGAAALADAVRDRELSETEVVRAHVERVQALAELNAVVVPRFEAALAEARRADEPLRSSEPVGPLHGVPITVKEAIALEGPPWTNGSRLTAHAVADGDAGAVRRLRAAGSIPIGKTNVPEFCGFYDTDNEVHGRTPSPHDREHIPGGSCGGEAAALAEDLDLALSVMVGGFGAAPAGRPARIAVSEEDGLEPVARACRGAVRSAATALSDAGHEVVDAAPSAGFRPAARPRGKLTLCTCASALGLPAASVPYGGGAVLPQAPWNEHA
jgi:Asp-tRNA(Asn)/Glu-tRNA(Gln) amidotransferase A subunit family amidase